MPGFRDNETQRLIDEGNLNDGPSKWYFVCYIKDGKVLYEKVHPEKDKKVIDDKCSNGAQLFLVWHGQWRTDVFPLDYKLVLKNFKKWKT